MLMVCEILAFALLQIVQPQTLSSPGLQINLSREGLVTITPKLTLFLSGNMLKHVSTYSNLV